LAATSTLETHEQGKIRAVSRDPKDRASVRGAATGRCPIEHSVAPLDQFAGGSATVRCDSALKNPQQRKTRAVRGDPEEGALVVGPTISSHAIKEAVTSFDHTSSRDTTIIASTLKFF
jgi:hypothetical protein